MNTIKITAFILSLATLWTSCDKDKKYSKRLAGEVWKVAELSVNGSTETDLPTLSFDKCDIYDELCNATWTNTEGGMATFIWQFNESGKKFEISNQSDSIISLANSDAMLQCYGLSGVYNVEEHKKDNMEFTSTATMGYPGKTVIIKMEKQ